MSTFNESMQQKAKEMAKAREILTNHKGKKLRQMSAIEKEEMLIAILQYLGLLDENENVK